MSHEGLADTSTSHCVADLTFSKQQEEEVKGSSRLDLKELYELRLLSLKRRSVTRVCTVVITLLLQLIYYILSGEINQHVLNMKFSISMSLCLAKLTSSRQ